jgi:hypothetical protein
LVDNSHRLILGEYNRHARLFARVIKREFKFNPEKFTIKECQCIECDLLSIDRTGFVYRQMVEESFYVRLAQFGGVFQTMKPCYRNARYWSKNRVGLNGILVGISGIAST